MVELNFDEGLKEDAGLEPGVYLAEVFAATEKRSKSGDPQIELQFCAPELGRQTLCRDYLTFGGKSKGIAYKKLLMLGIPRQEGVVRFNAQELIGKRVFLNLVEGEYDGKFGKQKRLEVYGGEGFSFGYRGESEPPFTGTAPKPTEKPKAKAKAKSNPNDSGDPLSTDDDDTPF